MGEGGGGEGGEGGDGGGKGKGGGRGKGGKGLEGGRGEEYIVYGKQFFLFYCHNLVMTYLFDSQEFLTAKQL